MSETIQCVVISGDKRMDHIMHAADVFEPFKAYAVIEQFEVTLKPDTTAEKGVSDMIRVAEELGRRVVAAFIPGRPDGAYVDKSVKAISDGKKWCMLDRVLEAYKFTHYEFATEFLKGHYDI